MKEDSMRRPSISRFLSAFAVSALICGPGFADPSDGRGTSIGSSENREPPPEPTRRLSDTIMGTRFTLAFDTTVFTSDRIATEADRLPAARRLVERFLEAHEVNAIAGNGKTALMDASWRGNLEVVQVLIERGADVNIAALENRGLWGPFRHKNTGWTALMFATERGKIECIRRLLSAGADPQVRSRAGKTALSIAEDYGHEEVARFLRERAAGRPAEAR